MASFWNFHSALHSKNVSKVTQDHFYGIFQHPMIFSRMIKLTHTCVCCKHNISKFGSFHFCGVKSGSFGKMCCFCNRLVDWGFCVGGLSTALGGKTSTKTRPSWIWKSTPLEDKGPTWGCHSRHQCIDPSGYQSKSAFTIFQPCLKLDPKLCLEGFTKAFLGKLKVGKSFIKLLFHRWCTP